MSRLADLLLLALVGGLGWWLFARPEGGAGDASGRRPDRVAGASTSPGGEHARGATADPAADPATALAPATSSPSAIRWAVDDPLLLAHPALRFVAERPAGAGLAPLAWSALGDGLAESPVGELRALGVAVDLGGTLEVVAWVPLAATAVAPNTVRLADHLQRVTLAVTSSTGASIPPSEVEVRWPDSAPRGALGEDSLALVRDAAHAVLLPRRAGIRVVVRARGEVATLTDPEDGRTVVLAAAAGSAADSR